MAAAVTVAETTNASEDTSQVIIQNSILLSHCLTYAFIDAEYLEPHYLKLFLTRNFEGQMPDQKGGLKTVLKCILSTYLCILSTKISCESNTIECQFQFNIENYVNDHYKLNKVCEIHCIKNTQSQCNSIMKRQCEVCLNETWTKITLICVDPHPQKPFTHPSPCQTSFPQCQ